jgi:hypothetical protein
MMLDEHQRQEHAVVRYAAVGAFCTTTAAVLSVVAVYATGIVEKCGLQLPVLQAIFLSLVLLPIGAALGAIVGLFLRYRERR